MSYELPDPQRDEDELVPSCSPAKSGPGQIAADRQEFVLVPAPVRTLQPGDVTEEGRTVLRVTPLSGRLCVRFGDDDTLWRMHGDSTVWIWRPL